MIRTFERVYITEDLTGTPYVKVDVGVVAHIYDNAKGYEIEFFAIDGTTLSVETVPASIVKSCEGIKSVPHILNKAA
ncbi:MAG: hypothetical protein POELPBGB_00322 [Bacteroidia bacterium]|nr:hypothetical protein [Bacteroidia bacterium]